MQLLITLFITTLSLFTTPNKPPAMGTSYDIIPNKKTKCANDFGNGLSFFFEQVGGYGETAEVEQVSQILNIDLSVFQDIDYNYEDKNDVAEHWHDIDSLSLLVDIFINKIAADTDYYKQVHHNPADRNKQIDEENELWKLTDTAERDRKIEAMHQQPFYYYPNDYGYLSEGRIVKDLQTLRKTLDCYKKSGVTKVRFGYT